MMSTSRREFIQTSFKTVVVIGLGNTLQAFSSDDFSLPPAAQIKLRFALASDGHFGQAGTNFHETHDQMMSWLNKEGTGRGLDFTVINGDLIHDDPRFLEEVKKKYDQLKMPYYVTHGNHDQCNSQTWEKIWKRPLNYSFELKDAAFITLDTANETGAYVCPDINFAKAQLEKFSKKKHVFVFMHITPYTWTKNGIDCPELVNVFAKQANLKAIFHGHDHDQDNVKTGGGKPYFFDSHIGGNWGTDYRGYRIVEVLKSGKILTYQMNPISGKKVNTMNV